MILMKLFHDARHCSYEIMFQRKPPRFSSFNIYLIMWLHYYSLLQDLSNINGGFTRKYELHNLHYLSMSVSFDDLKEILTAVSLLQSAPNLQELSIESTVSLTSPIMSCFAFVLYLKIYIIVRLIIYNLNNNIH